MLSRKLTYLLIFLLLSFNLRCQESFKDTIRINLRQADSIFLKQNVVLLSAHYNLDAARAQIIQARLFNNPTISTNQLVYNTETSKNSGSKWFDFSNTGETTLQIQKLFLLAGKRNKQIKIAEMSADREAQNYFDILRTLKYSLRSGFYNIYYLQQILKVYDKEIVSLNKLTEAFQNQYEKGYVSKKELLRLKSTLFSLENERLDFSSQLINGLNDFNVLIHTSNIYLAPKLEIKITDSYSTGNLKLQALMDTAFQNRYDLRMAETDVDLNQLNLAYQKAKAIPDITLSTGWDRNGSYVHNMNFIGVQIDLPFSNRNQGSIQSARSSIESSKYKLLNVKDQVKADVISAYANAVEINRLYTNFDNKFVGELEALNKEMTKNYEKRNISLIEFLDYFDAYKENAVQLNTLQYNRLNAFETINFCVGKDIINN